jgi:hypothetical protein
VTCWICTKEKPWINRVNTNPLCIGKWHPQGGKTSEYLFIYPLLPRLCMRCWEQAWLTSTFIIYMDNAQECV